MRTKIYTRPKTSEVKDWYKHYQSDRVTVEQAIDPLCDFYKVTVAGQRPKYFFGECAWMDSRCHAADVDFAAWTCFDN
jgi:hypothetical protein